MVAPSGDQSRTGNMGLSVSDLDTVVADLLDEQHEVVEPAAHYEIQDLPTANGTGDPKD
jgi:hypothetical protein